MCWMQHESLCAVESDLCNRIMPCSHLRFWSNSWFSSHRWWLLPVVRDTADYVCDIYGPNEVFDWSTAVQLTGRGASNFIRYRRIRLPRLRAHHVCDVGRNIINGDINIDYDTNFVDNATTTGTTNNEVPKWLLQRGHVRKPSDSWSGRNHSQLLPVMCHAAGELHRVQRSVFVSCGLSAVYRQWPRATNVIRH